MVRRLSAGGKRIRTFGPHYTADAVETILVAWLAFAFLPERPPRSQGGTDRRYGAGGEEMATSSLHLIDGVPAMPQPNDLSRSLIALDQNSTIIAVVELSQSSWLVGGMLPGIERQPCVAPAMQHGKQPFWARL